jgi:hypothetical protein
MIAHNSVVMRSTARLPREFGLLPRGLSREESAIYVGVSPGTFDLMVRDGTMPRPTWYRRRQLWDRRVIDRALDAFFNLDTRLADAKPTFAV